MSSSLQSRKLRCRKVIKLQSFLPHLLMELVTKPNLLITALYYFLQPNPQSYSSFQSHNLVILVFESRWLWCGAQRLYLLYYQVTSHPCIQGCGRPCGLMCKGISSITCFSCNPVLKMQASKLLIKRLLYNLQNQKHNEFPSCTSIRIVINNLLKGKQRSNPPSRYLKERRRKYPSAASDQNIYETNNFW